MPDPIAPAPSRSAVNGGAAVLMLAAALGAIASPVEAAGPATAAPPAPPAPPAASPAARPGRVPDQVWSTNPRPLPAAPMAPVAPAGAAVLTPVIIVPVAPHHHPASPRPQPSAAPPVIIHRPERP
jgi:hypothetical protein